MRHIPLCLALLTLTLAGCPAPTASNGGSPGAPVEPHVVTAPEPAAPEMDASEPGESEPEGGNGKQAGGQVVLTPANTRIQFVGTHKGDKPDPRTGSFAEFAGTATVDNGALKSIQVEIDTASLTTEIEKLTAHLKSPDFFDVRQHPQATFQTTGIEDAGDGKVNITGDLTLLGNTRSITFPATVSTTDGFSLESEFTIDRTEFGMNFGIDNVEPAIAMTITVTK